MQSTVSSKLLLGSVLLAASMWWYVDAILVPYQIADALRAGRPRGNLSDLYPRWLGSRELLLHGRDPYSAEITREIQSGYYGRPLDSDRPNDPHDQQGFAYPVYVAFLLAPTLTFSFATVQFAARWIFLLMIAASVPLWAAAVRVRMSVFGLLTATVLVLGSFPAVQAIKLQQLTILVCILMAGSAAALATGHLALSGSLLALATIKPQLAVAFACWVMLWSVGDWPSRRRFFTAFLSTIGVLVGAGELVLPGWIGRFRHGTAAYFQYAGGRSLLDLALTPAVGRAVSWLIILSVGWLCWRQRRAQAQSEAFQWMTAIVLAATLVIIPTFAPYNQLLLVPAVLLIAQKAPATWAARGLHRLSLLAAVAVIASPWLAAIAVDLVLVFQGRDSAERGWTIPLWTSWAIPFPVLAAVALYATRAFKNQVNARMQVTDPH